MEPLPEQFTDLLYNSCRNIIKVYTCLVCCDSHIKCDLSQHVLFHNENEAMKVRHLQMVSQ